MDYTKQSLRFKVRKVLRYIRLYGLRRTLVKVKGQYHMKKHYKVLPKFPLPVKDNRHVGIIGCGNFAYSVIAFYLNKNYGRVIRGAMDIDIHKAVSLYHDYGLSYYTDDARRIIEDQAIDLIYIASNHASHAEYAIEALKAGKNVHIEKPHVVNEGQLKRLCSTMAVSKEKVNLGFNRPHSPIGRTIKRYVDSETGPSMLNWFIGGHRISPEHWYFKEEEGGRVLGNLCHWTDFTLQLVELKNRYPLVINPTRWAKSDCDIAVTYIFGDGSIAAITFSAKGHTFEGVRECFAAHRGNVLINMHDFKSLTVDIVEKKIRMGSFFRNYGHETNVKVSYELVRPGKDGQAGGCSVNYVWETGNLFLKTKQALETNQKITIESGIPEGTIRGRR